MIREPKDILTQLTPQMVLPYILVALAVGFVLGTFKFFGVNYTSVALIVIPLVGIAAVVYYNKMLGLLLFFAYINVRIGNFPAPNFQIQEGMIPGLFFILIIQMMMKMAGRNMVMFRDVPFSVYFFFGIALLSFFVYGELPSNIFGFRRAGAFRGYYALICGGIAYVLVLSLFKEKRQIRTVMKIFIIVSTLSVGYLFFLIATGRPYTVFLPFVDWTIHHIGAGFLPIRNIMLGQSGVMLFQALLIFKYPRRLWIRLLLFLVALVAALISGGRLALLALVITLLAYTFFKRKYFLTVAAVLLGAVVILLPLLHPDVVEYVPKQIRRIVTFLPTKEEMVAGRGLDIRVELWGMISEEIKRSPFLGTGIRPVELEQVLTGAIPKHRAFFEFAVKSGAGHNLYLSIAQTLGIPALLVFLFILIHHLKKSMTLYRSANSDVFRKIGLYFTIYLVCNFATMFAGGTLNDPWRYIMLGSIQAVWLMYMRAKNQQHSLTANAVKVSPSKD